MAALNKKTAIVLFNLGGPDQPDAIRPFLFNLFNDKTIISLPRLFRFFLAWYISSKREKKARAIYDKIGGKSPLLDITLSQAYALEKELSFTGDFKVFVAMRYWKPYAKDVVKDIAKYDPDNLILLPLYPQFSTATSESSIKDFADHFLSKRRKLDKEVTTKIVCCYPTEPDFIKSHSLLIKQTLIKDSKNDLSKYRFLFSAHGLPQKLINRGDPYVFHVKETTKKIVENLRNLMSVSEEEIDYRICYQSKVGRLKWTSPSLDQEIKRVALDHKIPVIIPVAFVSDHSETLVELDIDYKEMAQKLGITDYLRVPALNIDGHFIKSLSKICQDVNSNDEFSIFSGSNPARICPKKMRLCINSNNCSS